MFRGENVSDVLSRALCCSVSSSPSQDCVSRITPESVDIPLILLEFHLATGHRSATSMKHHILRRYFWRCANANINNFVANCLICPKNSVSRSSNSCTPIRVFDVNDLWEVDTVGPINDSCGRPCRILTIIGVFLSGLMLRPSLISALSPSRKVWTVSSMPGALRNLFFSIMVWSSKTNW